MRKPMQNNLYEIKGSVYVWLQNEINLALLFFKKNYKYFAGPLKDTSSDHHIQKVLYAKSQKE